jgi:hypothetical protein
LRKELLGLGKVLIHSNTARIASAHALASVSIRIGARCSKFRNADLAGLIKHLPRFAGVLPCANSTQVAFRFIHAPFGKTAAAGLRMIFDAWVAAEAGALRSSILVPE